MQDIRFSRFTEVTVFLILVIFVLLTQNNQLGFNKGHHGWVSAHNLANISHVGYDTSFVGYSMAIKNEAGEIGHEYFMRSPVLLSFIMNKIIDNADSMSEKIYLARQCMNLIFLITLWVGYLILKRLLSNQVWAFSAVLLAASGFYVMYYKDMVHLGQPALLGMMLCTYGIVLYKQTGRRFLLYLFAILGVNLGLGYPSLAVLGLWLCMEVFGISIQVHGKLPAIIWSALKMDATKVFVLCVLISAANVVHNAIAEARVRHVGIEQTSVVQSAKRRLGLAPSFTENRPEFGWGKFLHQQLKRIIVNTVPYPPFETLQNNIFYYSGRVGILGVLVLVSIGLYIIISFLRKTPSSNRMMYALLLLSGVAWLLPMKNLAVPHNYTTMYYFGMMLVFYAALVSKVPKRLRSLVLPVSLAVFVVSNISVNAVHSSRAAEVNTYSRDFDTIRRHLTVGSNVYIDGKKSLAVPQKLELIEGVPYAVGFYLPDQYLTPFELADYSVSQNPSFTEDNITPENTYFFLFRNEQHELGR